jgi:hypothetical protein
VARDQHFTDSQEGQRKEVSKTHEIREVTKQSGHWGQRIVATIEFVDFHIGGVKGIDL